MYQIGCQYWQILVVHYWSSEYRSISTSPVVTWFRGHTPFFPITHAAVGAGRPGLQPLRGRDQAPSVNSAEYPIPVCCASLHWLHQVWVCGCVVCGVWYMYVLCGYVAWMCVYVVWVCGVLCEFCVDVCLCCVGASVYTVCVCVLVSCPDPTHKGRGSGYTNPISWASGSAEAL